MAAFSSKGRVNGNRTESAHYDAKGKPNKLPKDIKALRDKYGAEVLYQILGRGADGSDSGADAVDGLNQRNVETDTSFPVRLYQPDPYDTAVELKAVADTKLFGKKMMTDKDVEYLARKRDQLTAAEFKQFVASMYNRNDPAQQALLHAAYPELIEEQKQIINDRFELQKRLAMMALVGHPESKEDFALLFALNSGAIELPTGNIWDPNDWGGSVIAEDKETAITRGMFSPVKVSLAGKGDTTKSPFNMLSWALPGGDDKGKGKQLDAGDWIRMLGGSS